MTTIKTLTGATDSIYGLSGGQPFFMEYWFESPLEEETSDEEDEENVTSINNTVSLGMTTDRSNLYEYNPLSSMPSHAVKGLYFSNVIDRITAKAAVCYLRKTKRLTLYEVLILAQSTAVEQATEILHLLELVSNSEMTLACSSFEEHRGNLLEIVHLVCCGTKKCEKENTFLNLLQSRRLSRVWMNIDSDIFYTVLLPEFMFGLPKFLEGAHRISTIYSLILLFIRRISEDLLFELDFGIVILDTDLLIGAFEESCVYLPMIAPILSLFVHSNTVFDRCMMVMEKSEDKYNKFALQQAIERSYDCGLSLACISLCQLMHDNGISEVLELCRRVQFPRDLLRVIHRYYFSVVWQYVDRLGEYCNEQAMPHFWTNEL